MVGKTGWDDWIISLTTVLSILGMGEVIVQVQHGAGRHIGDIPPRDIPTGLMFNYITQLTYLYGICFCKLAVGASLLRIASTKFWKHLVLGVMIFVFTYTTAGFVTLLAQCTDIRILWDPSTKATCWAPRTLMALGYTNFSLNIITDLMFALFIPVPMLWNINVTRRTRVSLFCVLGLGCFACACAIVRFTFLGTYRKKDDWLWDTQSLTTWTVLEMNVGITAASLPSLRPLFKKVLGSIYGPGSKLRGYYAGGSSGRIKKNWQNLSGRNVEKRNSAYSRPLDNDEAFYGSAGHNTVQGLNEDHGSEESFELFLCPPMQDSDQVRVSRNPSVKTFVEARRSLEDGITTPTDVHVKGITKTTSTTVTYQLKESRLA
ncbi:hypothetical protein KVR01_006916 [Diaporthe batatas]|uniref:uncharacterized protein n=1 Tax=Diaporthe batatas TaxID=748121 RepID=UPI001D037A0F|nr:uncharacterized protein KVR01_006916 [Diaporthe batatas]KAG8163619.1 hypothetical protein KVR01_006916 [Diaporthe batatas]